MGTDLVYVVGGVHFHIPGRLLYVHRTLLGAQVQALELTNMLRDYVDLPPHTEESTWEDAVEEARVKRAADMGYPNVEDLNGSEDDGWVEIFDTQLLT